MKTITITPDVIRREVRVLLFLLAVTYIGNVISIIIYDTSWSELFTSLGYVCIISLVLYGFSSALRMLWGMLMSLVQPSKQ